MNNMNIKNNVQEDDANQPLSLKVDSKARDFSNQVQNVDFDDLTKRREIVKRVDNYGVEVLQLAEQRSKNLSSMISQMANDSTSNNELDKNIEKLEKEIRTIDPSNIDFTKVVSGFKKIFSPITSYFNKVEQEDEAIESVIESLNAGRSILSNDNITLELEIDKINDTIKMLQLEYDVGTKVKERIEAFIDDARKSGEDSNKIDFYESEVVIPLEKKLFDIKQVIIVNQQSCIAMDIIRKNNKELIRNVDRIKNVALVAVNTAVMVAKSIYNQKIVLKKINGLASTSNNLFVQTNNRLSSEATDISKQISQGDISVDGLKKAFKEAFDTFEQITTDNKTANDNLKEKLLEIEVKD